MTVRRRAALLARQPSECEKLRAAAYDLAFRVRFHTHHKWPLIDGEKCEICIVAKRVMRLASTELRAQARRRGKQK